MSRILMAPNQGDKNSTEVIFANFLKLQTVNAWYFSREPQHWFAFNVFTFGQTKCDNINQMITLTN